MKVHHASYKNIPGFQPGYDVGHFFGGAGSLRQ